MIILLNKSVVNPAGICGTQGQLFVFGSRWFNRDAAVGPVIWLPLAASAYVLKSNDFPP